MIIIDSGKRQDAAAHDCVCSCFLQHFYIYFVFCFEQCFASLKDISPERRLTGTILLFSSGWKLVTQLQIVFEDSPCWKTLFIPLPPPFSLLCKETYYSWIVWKVSLM